ncbi:MAG: hypothetical protein WC854_02465 [Bacteroidales bacterium]
MISPKIVPGIPEIVPGIPEIVPGTPEIVPGIPEIVPGITEIVPGTPEIVPGITEIVPGTPEIVPGRRLIQELIFIRTRANRKWSELPPPQMEGYCFFFVHFLIAKNQYYFLCLETKKATKENSRLQIILGLLFFSLPTQYNSLASLAQTVLLTSGPRSNLQNSRYFPKFSEAV